jgi:hypothetical protein
MGVLGDKLQEALNTVDNYIWKGPKREVAGEIMQPEIKLMDATEEQLNTFYDHCLSMLYNTDRKNPGRYVLLKMIKEQQEKCNIELFVRYVEGKYLNSSGRPFYSRHLYYKDLKELLDNNIEVLPKEKYSEVTIDNVTSDSEFPAEFRDVTIEQVRDACLDGLGVLDRSHLSTNFITKLGIWFTPQERKDLEEYDPKTGKMRDRLVVIRERHNLRSNVRLKTNQAGLTYAELRSMLNLRTKKYSELTTDQLVLLRNKVLFRFIEEIERHIAQWETRISQIEEVCKARGIELKSKRPNE